MPHAAAITSDKVRPENLRMCRKSRKKKTNSQKRNQIGQRKTSLVAGSGVFLGDLVTWRLGAALLNGSEWWWVELFHWEKPKRSTVMMKSAPETRNPTAARWGLGCKIEIEIEIGAASGPTKWDAAAIVTLPIRLSSFSEPRNSSAGDI